ncbi:MAG: ATP-binding cassette domain-containing protein [Dehalococcoidia bacterium]
MHVQDGTLRQSGLGSVSRGPAVIEARDIWFSYDNRQPVLRGVNLEVYPGEMTMILGRSGSGKTTLLRVLKGLLRPQRGAVLEHVNGGSHRHGAAIAYVPQTLGLVRSLSALDNALTGSLSRVGARSLVRSFPGSVVEDAKELISRLGLAPKIHEPVHRLSGGERQRIAIARALMQQPALILADEFVSQLDPITAENILQMMRGIAAERNVSLLVTTHETDIVDTYADRVIVMREGVIIHDSPSADIAAGQMLALLR